jgi:DNA-binding FadR family transcriptional regulator
LTPRDAEALRANLEKAETSLDDTMALSVLDVEYHALVACGMHNRVLLLGREPMARLFCTAFQAVLSRVPESAARLLKAHRGIFTALQHNISLDASLWMAKQIRDFKVGFELTSLSLESSQIEIRSLVWSEWMWAFAPQKVV